MAKLNFYRLGSSAIFASQGDPRFGYCTFVPSGYDPEGSGKLPLIVLVHGSLRNNYELRDQFAEFAEAKGCAILAPLFPCGIGGVDDFNNYKHILYDGVRYDRVLLDMIDEVAGIFRIETGRFLMHGFSGGGQFAHRFYFLHPDRLSGVSIAAPGTVTLPGDPRPGWVGTGDMEETFGIGLRPDAMRKVPVQFVIGSADTMSQGVTVAPGSSFWMEGANDAGTNRVERLSALEAAFQDLDIPFTLDVVPDVGHDGAAIQPPVRRFFADCLAGRAGTGG